VKRSSSIETDQLRVLLPARRSGPVTSILWRLLLALSCIVITTVVVYLDREGYKDATTTPISWIDALYYSTVTLSTTGYGDIVPVTESARLLNIFVITPLRFIFLITLVGTTIEVLTKRSRDDFRASRWRRNMSGHTIVIGYGVKGRSTVASLVDNGMPASRIIVIDRTRECIAAANAFGCAGIVGDGASQRTLEEAKVAEATQVVVATGRDDSAVLATLTARRLSPKAVIVATVRESQNIEVLRQSGADNVIATSESAGRMLALSLVSPTAGAIIADLLEPLDGIEIMERSITPAELGLDPRSLAKFGDIVLAVVRGGVVSSVLQRDDRLVVVRPVSST
jgi:voltage-gated potassium channel